MTKGYIVLDDASFPIVGEGNKEPNDNFISQLVANGKAAIDAVDSLGYIDRNKVAVGGHSYGAFMTANLLTDSYLFDAESHEVELITEHLHHLDFKVSREITWGCS